MSKLFFATMTRLTPALKRGDLEACEQGVSEELRKLPPSPFHLVQDLAISNDPADAAQHFDHFLLRESKRLTRR